MIMKKYLLLTAAVMLAGGVAFAQKAKVTTAKNSLDNYNAEKKKDPAYAKTMLDKAKLNIDEASVHTDTKDDAKTWYYRGNVYMAIYLDDFNKKMDSYKDITDAGKKQSMAYTETPTGSLVEATNSYLKAKALDKYDVYGPEGLAKAISDCYVYTQNCGLANFGQKKYAEALPMFELAADISAANKVVDSLNINNAAVSAMNGKMYDKAIPHFKRLTEVNYGKGNTWLLLGQCYREKGDTASYKSTIADGLKKYPTDADLLTEDVNIKLAAGKTVEAVAQLEALTAQRKDDAELFFVVGNVYDRIANPTGPDGKPAAKPKNYEEMHEKAASNYKKSLELKPNNFDVLYNLGILYYNYGFEYLERSNSTIADAAKYSTLWEPALKTSVDYLEKARAIDPKDLNTLQALKVCYGNLGDNEKYNQMKEEIKKVQAGQ
jgi:tetratricopeptide (TPR) repeat protein